eukprot:353449-Rhodomonas_salina.6
MVNRSTYGGPRCAFQVPACPCPLTAPILVQSAYESRRLSDASLIRRSAFSLSVSVKLFTRKHCGSPSCTSACAWKQRLSSQPPLLLLRALHHHYDHPHHHEELH